MIEVEKRENKAVIRITDNILIDDVEVFEDKIREAFNDGISDFVFDFTPVEYICSAGLGILAKLLKDVYEERGGTVSFCSLTEKLKSVFDMMQFTAIVNVEASVDSAFDK